MAGVVSEQNGAEKVIRFPAMAPRRRAGPTEVAAACLMSSLATALRETKLKLPIEQIRADVIASSKKARAAQDLNRRFWFVAGGGECALPSHQVAFTELIEALIDTRRVSFDYVHFGGNGSREIDIQPLTLALHEHQFYVIGRRADGAYYPYRFSRMSNLSLGKAFAYPSPGEFDPAQLFENVFGIFIAASMPIEDVRVRLSPTWRHYVESHRWHGTQTHSTDAGGRVTIHLRVRQSNELTRWIMWFGNDAEVLEPASLRDEVAGRLKAAALQYGQTGGSTAKKLPRRVPSHGTARRPLRSSARR